MTPSGREYYVRAALHWGVARKPDEEASDMSDSYNAGDPRTNPDDTTADQGARRRGPGRLPGSATRASKSGHRIRLPDGDELMPRADKARELRLSERTLQRLTPTVMVGNVAYVKDKATNKVLADRASKPKRRHRRTRGL
jgi:hypothetical protein